MASALGRLSQHGALHHRWPFSLPCMQPHSQCLFLQLPASFCSWAASASYDTSSALRCVLHPSQAEDSGTLALEQLLLSRRYIVFNVLHNVKSMRGLSQGCGKPCPVSHPLHSPGLFPKLTEGSWVQTRHKPTDQAQLEVWFFLQTGSALNTNSYQAFSCKYGAMNPCTTRST